jgi:hypothetical protein
MSGRMLSVSLAGVLLMSGCSSCSYRAQYRSSSGRVASSGSERPAQPVSEPRDRERKVVRVSVDRTYSGKPGNAPQQGPDAPSVPKTPDAPGASNGPGAPSAPPKTPTLPSVPPPPRSPSVPHGPVVPGEPASSGGHGGGAIDRPGGGAVDRPGSDRPGSVIKPGVKVPQTGGADPVPAADSPRPERPAHGGPAGGAAPDRGPGPSEQPIPSPAPGSEAPPPTAVQGRKPASDKPSGAYNKPVSADDAAGDAGKKTPARPRGSAKRPLGTKRPVRAEPDEKGEPGKTSARSEPEQGSEKESVRDDERDAATKRRAPDSRKRRPVVVPQPVKR